MRLSKRNVSGGMSLLEIVIAITVILILAALLFPFIGSSREMVKRTQSLSNLRQIVGAMHHYANDNEDRFPLHYAVQSNPTREWAYPSSLFPYLYEGSSSSFLGSYPVSKVLAHEENVFISPTTLLPMTRESSRHWIVFTYSMHRGLGMQGNRPRRSQIVRPSEVILIGDGAQGATGGVSPIHFSQPNDVWRFPDRVSDSELNSLIPIGPNSDSEQGKGWLRYRSDDYATVAFVDGHVRSIKAGSVKYRNIVWDR